MALVFKDFDLDLSGVPDKDKKEVKDRVADLLYNEVLRAIAKGKSPVRNEGNFKILDEDYAKKEKQGNRTPNLQLEGDLIREDFATKALKTDTIRIGHFNEATADTQGEKADGHNQHSAKAQAWAAEKNFPKRRYIPTVAQTFNEDILRSVENIISKYRKTETIDEAAEELQSIIKDSGKVTTVKQNAKVTSIALEDYLSEDYLALLIGDRLNNG